MKRLKLRAGFVIFLLYTGIAVLEGIRTKNWASITFWAILALTFLLLDSGKRVNQPAGPVVKKWSRIYELFV